MTSMAFESPSGYIYTFNPDDTSQVPGYETWPETAQGVVREMGFADKLVLESMCWEIIHAVSPPLPPEKEKP